MRIAFEDAFTPVDHSSSIPLYLQITTQVDGAMRRGRLPSGTLLPAEQELCAGFTVARTTLRRALASLEQQGTITRERGRGGGTRISSTAPISRDPSKFATIFEMIAATDRQPRTRLVMVEDVVVDAAFSDLSGYRIGQRVVHFVRYRSANEIPVAVLENWLAAEVVTFDRRRVENESMDALLSEAGIHAHHAEFELKPTSAGTNSEFLEIDPATPVINEIRYLYDERMQYDYSNHMSHPRHERFRGVITP